MKTVLFTAIAAASVAVSAPAFAQDAAPFTGPRAEVLAGYDSVKGTGSGTADGFQYGVALGYDFAAGGAVLGLEGEVSDSTASVSGIDAARDFYIGARAGLPIGSTALAYVKPGYSNARFEAGNFHETIDGVRVGAGLEYNLGGSLFVKGEYRYSNYEQGLSRHQVTGGLGIRF